MGLGSDLDVSLAKAREAASAARAMCVAGTDPLDARSTSTVIAKPSITFGAFALEWLDRVEDGFRNAEHRQQWRNTLTKYAAPLFPLAIDAVTTEAILEVLKPIWLTKAETASRLRGRIERVLDAAKVSGLRIGENPARGRGHLDLLLPKRSKADVKHHAALPFTEIRSFVADLKGKPGTAARALEFTILTAARSGEVRGMTWAEIDLQKQMWTVPGDRMKAGVARQVPLSKSAIEILESIKPSNVSASMVVFSAPRGGEMSDMSLSAVLKRMKRTEITVHGFRSTFRDWAGETTSFGREEIEMALAHTIESSTERAYRRGRSLEKRRELMKAWSEYCGFV